MFLKMSPAIVCLTLSTISPICSAQTPTFCDQVLLKQTNRDDSDRYSLREKNRCEGVYFQQVAGVVGNLPVASFTAVDGRPTSWPQNGHLILHWNQRSDRTGPVHVEGFSLAPHGEYKLDVSITTGTSYDWKTDTVVKYLAPSEVGLVAWTTVEIGGRQQRLYLPLTIGKAAPKAPYTLSVVPPVDLLEVYISVVALDNKIPLRKHLKNKYGFYQKDQRIDVDMPPLPKAGLYWVVLVGVRRDEGSVATRPFLIDY